VIRSNIDYEAYIRKLIFNWGKNPVDRALSYLKKRVGFTTTREQARFLAYVFEYDSDDKGSEQVYNIYVRDVRKHLGIPLTLDYL